MRYPLPTNTATAAFLNGNRRDAIDLDLEEIGRSGSGRIIVKVLGYWSSDVMVLYINRRCNWTLSDDEASYWEFEMSHSSGGRDTGEELDSLRAEANFARAMLVLSEWAQNARHTMPEALEAAYQRQRAEDKAEREAQELAKQQAIEADTPLGENLAKGVVAFLEGQARQAVWREIPYRVFSRGAEKPCIISAICKGDRITFRTSGNVISRKALIVELAASSHRTAKES